MTDITGITDMINNVNVTHINQKVVWGSLDPVRNKIDFYPKTIAYKIEKSYKDYISSGRRDINYCELGSDFYNATIYFPIYLNSKNFYQRTKAIFMGRNGYKPEGFRSVFRLDVSSDKKYKIYTKKDRNEGRIIYDSILSEREYEGIIPEENIIDINYIADIPEIIRSWEPEDLVGEDLDKNIIIWQWCIGTQENQGNLMALGEEWWKPYFYEQNKEIENAFKESFKNNHKVTIDIPTTNSQKVIKFIQESVFANQIDCNTGGTRSVKRITTTIRELKKKLENINNMPIDINKLATQLVNDNIPYEYICSISQSIMTDPVKTEDGMVYDRSSIEKWFTYRHTSPLTGLPLTNIRLTPYIELKENIENYIKLKTNKI